MEQTIYKIEDLLPVVSELATEYCGYEHSSVSYEKAQELMKAALYCIHEYEFSSEGMPLSFKTSPKDAYLCGREMVKHKFEKLQEIYRELMEDFEDYGMECLRDVATCGILEFIEKYDIKYAPQETFLTFDYPIIKSIQGLSGVDAVLEYTDGIYLEQQFLKKFDVSYILEILQEYCREYEFLLENICCIVILNIVGHFILKKPLSEKGWSRSEREIAEGFLLERTEDEIEIHATDKLFLI